MKSRFVSLLVMFTLAGCNGAASADALIGTWFAQVTPTTSDNQTVTVTFRADRSYSLTHTQHDSAFAPTPGCDERQDDVGSYVVNNSSGMMSLTLMPNTSTSGRVVSSGCTNPRDNRTYPLPSTPFSLNGSYTMSGDTLTVDTLIFTRR